MLSKLFGSHSRVKILKAFLFHPEERYYIRQLSRDLNLQVNSVRRELDNLQEFGLLLSETSSGQEKQEGDVQNRPALTRATADGQEKKYYRLNKSFPLFEDIKALISKSQLLHKESFTKDLERTDTIKLLILTEAFVNRFDAQTDVLIVGKVNRDKLLKTIQDLERELGREVNFTLFSVAEFKYRREIADIFLYDILEKEKIIIIDEVGLK